MMKIYKRYYIIIVLFFIFNLLVCLYIYSENKNKNILILSSYMNTLINDVKTLEKYKNLFLSENQFKKDFYINFREYNENIDNIIPDFVNYKISINELLIKDENIDTNNSIFSNIKISENYNLQIYLGFNKKSDFYKENEYFVVKIIISYVISSVILFFAVIFFLKKNEKFYQMKLKGIEETLYKEILSNKNFSNQKCILDKLNTFFSKKITEIYIKAEYGSSDKIPLDKYIFPMILFDDSEDVLDIKTLTKDLEDYFSLMFENISVNINTSVEYIKLKCSKEAFYQIIFSVVFNIINFMHDQSSLAKKLDINFSKKMINIEYDSFCLDEKTLVRLSEKLIMKKSDIFFLSFEKIFKSLEGHNFKYEIKSNKESDSNKFNIIYPINTPNKKECNIIDITKYKNENNNKLNNK